MKLGDLKAQFKGLINNNVVNKNDALVSTFINQAIMRIQRELRVPFMEKQVVYTIPSGFTKLTIPSDMLELIAIMVDGDADGIMERELRRTDLNRVMTASQTTNEAPFLFTRQGGYWVLGPTPAVGAQVMIHYYAEFTALVDDTSENTCLKVAWDAVLYGALSAAADYILDERVTGFEGRYNQIMKQIQEQADADELTADAVVAPVLQFDTDGNW